MGKKILGIIKLILCVLILTYAESYFFELLAWVGLDHSGWSALAKALLILVLYLVIAYAIYLVYRDDLSSDFSRFKRNWFPNVLMSVVFFAIITIVVWVVGYLCEALAGSFRVNYLGLSYLNVFNKVIDFNLVLLIIKRIMIIPFISTSIYILGVNEIFDSKKAGMFFSGLVAAVVAALSLRGNFLFVLINVIPYFTLCFGLAYIYRKNNNNIWFSITSSILYTLLAGLLIAKFI